jgi:hypothetical protein
MGNPIRGYDGAVYAGGVKVARVLEFDYDERTETEWSKPKGMAATVKAGHTTGGGNVTCEWDPADAGQVALEEGEEVTLELYPEVSGDGHTRDDGDLQLSGTVAITDGNANSPQTGFCQKTFAYEGLLTEGAYDSTP